MKRNLVLNAWIASGLVVIASLVPISGCQWLEKKAETDPERTRLSLDDDPSFALPASARSSTDNSSRLGGVSKEARAIERRLGVSSN